MRNPLLDKTFVRFLMVGVVNTLFGTAIMFVFYNVFHLSYWISSASNYFFGSILSYFLNRYFTFQNRSRGWRTVVRFTVNITVCYLAAYGLAKPLVRWALSGAGKTIQENGAMLVGMCLFVMPVIGLTLPFISYGGTSIVTLFAAMGMVSGIQKRARPEWLR